MWRRACIVRTTAEVLLALLPEWEFAREPDALRGVTSWWCGRLMSQIAMSSLDKKAVRQ